MKFLHTGDLHIGKKLKDMPLLEDQKTVLGQIVQIAEQEQVDAVLISGDVYQKSAPSADAMTVWNDFITDLARLGKKIFVISGNHDSDQRISYLSSVVKSAGVYVSEKFEGRLQQYEFTDEYGSIVISLLPFVKPIAVRKAFAEAGLCDENEIPWDMDGDGNQYEKAVGLVLQNSNIDTQKRNVLLCHQFLTNSVATGDEERAVGGLDDISFSLFDAFDYVALGHIHGAQQVGRKSCRYAGSIMKYSLSEEHHNKSVTIVDMREKGCVDIKQVLLNAPHDLRSVQGRLKDILNMKSSKDYVAVTICDEEVPPDARIQVSTVFENMISFSVKNSKTGEMFADTPLENVEDKDIRELIVEFYKKGNNGIEPSNVQMKLVDEILEEMEVESYDAD